ncbi:hypothetical protein B9Z55_001607 [Caenorhabditis nigoni]|uniref:Uncharacterized protein n=1 Tax=Caenorhabditis nigoni TaxID=1611254 RepID=A0A2G5VGM2_9PELO|nr:hypothetical protein B9Z55_001607 [Caenorhabditis nigoni]
MKQSQARHIVPAQDFTKQRSTNQVFFNNFNTSLKMKQETKLSSSETDRKVTGGAQQKWTDDKEEKMPRKSSFNELSSRRSETSPEDFNNAEEKNSKKTLSTRVNIMSGETAFEPSRYEASVAFRNRVSRKKKSSIAKPGEYAEEHCLATAKHVKKSSAQVCKPANPFNAIKPGLQASVQPKKPSNVQVLRMSKDPRRRRLCHDVKSTGQIRSASREESLTSFLIFKQRTAWIQKTHRQLSATRGSSLKNTNSRVNGTTQIFVKQDRIMPSSSSGSTVSIQQASRQQKEVSEPIKVPTSSSHGSEKKENS